MLEIRERGDRANVKYFHDLVNMRNNEPAPADWRPPTITVVSSWTEDGLQEYVDAEIKRILANRGHLIALGELQFAVRSSGVTYAMAIYYQEQNLPEEEEDEDGGEADD